MKYAWMVFTLAVVVVVGARAEEPQAPSLDARVGQLEAKLTMLEIRVKALEQAPAVAQAAPVPHGKVAPPEEAKTAKADQAVIDLAQMLPFNAGAPATAKGKNVFGVVRVMEVRPHPQDPRRTFVIGQAQTARGSSTQYVRCVLSVPADDDFRFKEDAYYRIRGHVVSAQIVPTTDFRGVSTQTLQLSLEDVQETWVPDPSPSTSVGGTFNPSATWGM